VQTRPGNEPEPDPEESADGAEAGERDPFTPKVPPVSDDEHEGEGEAEAEEPGGADLAETIDLRSLPAEPDEPEGKNAPRRPKKHAGQMSSETVSRPVGESGDEQEHAEPVAESKPGRSDAVQPGGENEPDRPDTRDEQEPAEPVAESHDEPDQSEKPAEHALAETVSLDGPAQDRPAVVSGDEADGEREPDPSEKPAEQAPAETVNLRDLLPEESAAEGDTEAEHDLPELAETVNLRDLLPEGPADKSSKEQAKESAESEPEPEPEPEPPLRRRTPPEGEPLRRRPVPGGQPPRRPGPGQDPRRGPGPGPGYPHAGESGPRRRPPSEHAPDHAPDRAGNRRPGPESRPAAAAAASGAAASAAASGPAASAKPVSVSLGRRRLLAAFWPPRMSRNQAVVGVLLGALGAALAIQVHATNTSDEILRGARSDDLVNILDEVTSRGQSLDAELRNLETQNAAIRDSADKAQAALAQAQQKAKDLQILSGTVKAKGSGITMTITDPQGQLKSATLLNALEELRAAGAEVVQVDDVRVVVSSSFVDTADGGIALDGHELTQPYVYKVIGDPNTLGPAMQIPGGVVATVKSSPGANATIAPGQVLVDAVAPQPNPDYAKAG
jgi:uncharacterized protein YlxW (UPF0749 family)